VSEALNGCASILQALNTHMLLRKALAASGLALSTKGRFSGFWLGVSTQKTF